jgi:succinate dehydrogenase / fumarate reductase cytochrome b subunit
MNGFIRLANSSLGKKYLMAITGLGLFLFVVFHMMGNLQIFLGREAINHYGHMLKANPEFLWPARIGLVVFVIIHIWTSIVLTLENRAKREQPYAVKRIVAASFASRTMIYSGLLLLSYIVYHLFQFTVLVTNPEYAELRDQLGRHDIYRMTVLAFSDIRVSAVYIFGMGFLCLHLSHGASSMFQSIGLKNEANCVLLDRFGLVAAWVIFVGYSSVPLAVLLKWVK